MLGRPENQTKSRPRRGFSDFNLKRFALLSSVSAETAFPGLLTHYSTYHIQTPTLNEALGKAVPSDT